MVWRKLVVSIGLILALCTALADGRSFLDHFRKISTVKKSGISFPKQPPQSQPKGLFDWSGDEESIKELRLASVSLIKTALSIAMYGMAWTWFKKSLRGSFGHLSDFLRSQGLGVNTAEPTDIQPYIVSNSTFSDEETAILSQFQLPNTIDSSLEDLGGLREVKQSILQQYFVADKSPEPNANTSTISPEDSTWWKTEVFQSKHSALLFGPPGCGKTSLVRGLSRKLDCPLLEVTPSMIQHSLFGESTKKVRAIFSAARKLTRCVIFIDELDALFSARRQNDQSFERSVKTEFIQAWDTLLRNGNRQDIFVIGATNRPQDLDPAILRRFERSFLLPLPDDHDRVAIWEALLADVPLAVTHGEDFDFARCAKLTEGFCTSDIRQLCEMALGRTKTDLPQRLRPLYIQDIEDAANVFVPTTWVATSFGRGTLEKRGYKGIPPRHPFASTYEYDQYHSWSSPSPFDDNKGQ